MKTFVLAFGAAMLLGNAGVAAAAGFVDPLLKEYFSIHKSLSSDSTAGIAAASARLERESRHAADKDVKSKAALLALAEAAARFKAADLKSARNSFGEISERMITVLQVSDAGKNPPYQFYCSMVDKNWLQPDKSTRNPYYGSSMLTCGELAASAEPAGHSHH